MVPETLVLCLAAYYIGSFIDFRAPKLARLDRSQKGGYEKDLARLGGVGVIVGALF